MLRLPSLATIKLFSLCSFHLVPFLFALHNLNDIPVIEIQKKVAIEEYFFLCLYESICNIRNITTAVVKETKMQESCARVTYRFHAHSSPFFCALASSYFCYVLSRAHKTSSPKEYLHSFDFKYSSVCIRVCHKPSQPLFLNSIRIFFFVQTLSVCNLFLTLSFLKNIAITIMPSM